jgi:hypothetical protein
MECVLVEDNEASIIIFLPIFITVSINSSKKIKIFNHVTMLKSQILHGHCAIYVQLFPKAKLADHPCPTAPCIAFHFLTSSVSFFLH